MCKVSFVTSTAYWIHSFDLNGNEQQVGCAFSSGMSHMTLFGQYIGVYICTVQSVVTENARTGM